MICIKQGRQFWIHTFLFLWKIWVKVYRIVLLQIDIPLDLCQISRGTGDGVSELIELWTCPQVIGNEVVETLLYHQLVKCPDACKQYQKRSYRVQLFSNLFWLPVGLVITRKVQYRCQHFHKLKNSDTIVLLVRRIRLGAIFQSITARKFYSLVMFKC